MSYIIEKVSSQKYGDYIKENIFVPLNMLDSGYDYQAPLIKKRAHGYVYKNNILENVEFFNTIIAAGSGGLYSTVEDLYKFDQALYEHKILMPATLELMIQSHASYNILLSYHEGINPTNNYFGYAWFISIIQSQKTFWYDCALYGSGGIFMRFPETKSTIIILSNIRENQIKRALEIAKILFNN